MLGGADNPNGELLSYIIGADNIAISPCESQNLRRIKLGCYGGARHMVGVTIVYSGSAVCVERVDNIHSRSNHPLKIIVIISSPF
ncbi:hypothetical protein K3H96_RS22765 [Escherichia coli]|nr:hypothetical protein [Escherichia coli]EHY8935216.1 hypothetical protein [Escherichia coli]EIA1425135.1 hypothetical protein [Escherichia coli]